MENIEKLLKIFADGNRLRILKLLQQRKMCVCELAYALQVTQPSVSRHLKMMKKAGLIKDEQDKLWTNYYLIPDAGKARTLLKCLNKWLAGNKSIRSDFKRLKTFDRTKPCCRKRKGS